MNKASLKYTFDQTKRYITAGVNEKVPFEIRVLIWSLVDKLVDSDVTVDYLQVFTLKVEGRMLRVIHSQEQPAFEEVITLKLLSDYQSLDKLKLYCIDDITHSTLLLAQEY